VLSAVQVDAITSTTPPRPLCGLALRYRRLDRSKFHDESDILEITDELASIALDRLAAADISPRRPKGLSAEAWRIADRLGWAKTYDAEYLALARLLNCRLLTTDAKLKMSGSRVTNVIGPSEL